MNCERCKTGKAMRGKSICGVCECLESQTPPGGQQPKGWPWVSQAAGVHTSQIEEFSEYYRKAGLTSYHDEKGNLVCADRDQRKKTLAFRNLKDRDAGYSD